MGTLPLPWDGSIEDVVRSAVIIGSHLRDRPAKTAPVPEEEAEIVWGKASQFSWSIDTPDIRKSTYVTVIRHENNDDDLRQLIIFPEIERATETVRITNPQDAEQYVDVERITSITFQAPNVGEKNEIQQFWQFNLTRW